MAEGFRIAEGYLEITTRLSKAQIRAAAQEAAAEFDAASTGQYDKAGQHAGHDFASGVLATHDILERGMRESGTRAGHEFAHSAGDRLLNERGEFIHAGETFGKDIAGGTERTLWAGIKDLGSQVFGQLSDAWSSSGITDTISSIGSGLSQIGSFAQGAAMPIAILVGTIAALEIGPPILFAIAGGLASIPALAVGAASGMAALELGLMGVGAAIGQVFNPTGGGGGGAANRLDQIASAERNLATAERNEREAQQALTEARIQAAFHLQDLNLQMERQQENERGAALAIMEAQQALVAATATGDPLAIMRAQLNLQEAVTGLKEQKQQTVELAHTKSEADAKGVEGSDQVVAALDRVSNASNAVLDAQNAVKQASISAAGGAVTAYSKLSPEAKKFVDEIARLKPELIGLQQYVQDRLFVGLDRKLAVWATVWIPALRHDLGELAGDANTFAKRLGDDLSKPEIVSAVRGVADAMDRVFTRFTTGGALDKLVTAMGDLVTKATPFIEGLANAAVDKLANWADRLDRAAKDGALESFLKEASKDLHDIWDIGSDVFDIIGQILGAIFHQDVSTHDGKNALDRMKDTLDELDKWAHSANGKKTIDEIAASIVAIADAIGWVIVHIGRFIAKFQEFRDKGHRWITEVQGDFTAFETTVTGSIRGLVASVVGWFQQFITAADHAFSWVPGLGGKLDGARRDMDNFVSGFNTDVDRMKSYKDFTVYVRTVGSLASIAAQAVSHRWGGVHYADKGLLSLGKDSTGVYPPKGPLYGFAEPDTGGELFMARNAPPDRNKALATVAAQWAGLDVTPARSPIAAGMGMAGTSSGAPRTLQPVQIHVGDTHLVDLVLGVVKGNPVVVSATAAEGDRQRSFTNSARN